MERAVGSSELALRRRRRSFLVGGLFQSMGPLTRNNIAKVSTSGLGAADANRDPSADEDVLPLLPDADAVSSGPAFRATRAATRCVAHEKSRIAAALQG